MSDSRGLADSQRHADTVAVTKSNAARLRTGAYILAASALFGLGLAVIWVWLAPRPSLVVRDGNTFYESLGQSGIGVDMIFAVLAAACGVVAGVVVALTARGGEVPAIVAAALGGLVGSLIAWRLGEALVGGLQDDGRVLVPELANGESFIGPLQLSALGVLGVWSLAATILLTSTFVWRASRAGIRARRLSQEYVEAASGSNLVG
jgi:hypothetical protein